MKKTPPPTEVVLFDVDEYSGLYPADFAEPETRSALYDCISSRWNRSAKDLLEALDDCPPLAWEIQSLYGDARAELEAELAEAQDGGSRAEVAALRKRLRAMPEEPEEGAADWLALLSAADFREQVVPQVEAWLEDSPDWDAEEDYIPRSYTAAGFAYEYFVHEASQEALDLLKIRLVEGDRPGSNLCYAELGLPIAEANAIAKKAGLGLQFRRKQD